MQRVIPLPGVQGRIDHLSVDVKDQRLFVAALGNNSLEVIDLAARKVLQSLGGLQEPQGVIYVPDFQKVFVASGGDGKCRIYDASSMKLAEAVDFSGDADNVRYDAARKQIYVGYGNGALGILDAATNKRLGDIPLDAHPEAFQLERSGPRIFVNVPKAGHIAVVNRDKRSVITKWNVTGASANYPMALDEANHRLLIGCRKPPQVLVYDTTSGKQVAAVPSSGDADDLFYDAARKRVYLSAGEGFLDVFQQRNANHYERIAKVATTPGARTSLFVAEFNQLYLAVPHRGARRCEIRIYDLEATK